MVEYKDDELNAILKAVADPTRRSVLTTLVQQGPSRVTDLAAHYDMTLNAVSKHIKILESVDLVKRRKWGRVHLIEANLAPIKEVDNWFQHLKSIWELRLESLEHILKKEQ
jgi:DNA-binding transcriptional ArsR family regulator